MSSCPCGSGEKFLDCCGKYIRGQEPPTALALMRSRYSAYATGNVDYILRTTHPKNPLNRIPRPTRRKQILSFCQETNFERLEIVDFEVDDPFSTVTFRAHLIQDGKPVLLAEKSLFEKVDGHWLYLEGTPEQPS